MYVCIKTKTSSYTHTHVCMYKDKDLELLETSLDLRFDIELLDLCYTQLHI